MAGASGSKRHGGGKRRQATWRQPCGVVCWQSESELVRVGWSSQPRLLLIARVLFNQNGQSRSSIESYGLEGVGVLEPYTRRDQAQAREWAWDPFFSVGATLYLILATDGANGNDEYL